MYKQAYLVNLRTIGPVLASVAIFLCFGEKASAQTLSIANQSGYFGSYATVSTPTGTNTVNFAVQNAGPSSSAAAWCAIDSLHGGTTLASGTTATIAVNGSALVTTAALPIGYYDLYVAPSTIGCQGTGFIAASLAVILNNTTTADSRFGINMLAGVNPQTKYIGLVQQVATAMQAVGFGGARDQVTWKDLEKTYGAYSWPTSQPTPPCSSSMAGVTGFVCVFNNYYSGFSNNLLTVAYGNTNYTGGNTTPPSGATPISGFDNYVAALVAPLSSYPGKINPAYLSALGVWNEFSNDQFCTGCSSTISTRGAAYNSIVTTVRTPAGGKNAGWWRCHGPRFTMVGRWTAGHGNTESCRCARYPSL